MDLPGLSKNHWDLLHSYDVSGFIKTDHRSPNNLKLIGSIHIKCCGNIVAQSEVSHSLVIFQPINLPTWKEGKKMDEQMYIFKRCDFFLLL